MFKFIMKFKKSKTPGNTIGNFILELRKEKGYSQYRLADEIPISREAVSKWERNETKPNKASLDRLSAIFNVTTQELLLGRRLSDTDKKELEKMTIELFEQKNKIKKMLKISIIFILVLIISFLVYYFISSYNSIKVYRFKYDENNLVINNGIFVTTREKLYFSIGDILSDKEVKGLRLYYKDKNNQEITISSNERNLMFLYDYYGYNIYFEYKDLKQVLKNMYLEIIYEDDQETIKLNFYKDFANNLSHEERSTIVDEDVNDNSQFEISEEIIKRKFEFKDGLYTYTSKDLSFSYMEMTRILIVNTNENDIVKEWNYNFISKTLMYKEYEDDQEITSYIYSEDKSICNEECQEIMNYFYTNLAEVLK